MLTGPCQKTPLQQLDTMQQQHTRTSAHRPLSEQYPKNSNTAHIRYTGSDPHIVLLSNNRKQAVGVLAQKIEQTPNNGLYGLVPLFWVVLFRSPQASTVLYAGAPEGCQTSCGGEVVFKPGRVS